LRHQSRPDPQHLQLTRLSAPIQINDEPAQVTARRKAYDIIAAKGATAHGIGACVSVIADAVLHDKRVVLPLSAYVPEHDVVMGWPCVIGGRGVMQSVPVALDAHDGERVAASVKALKAVAASATAAPIAA